MAAPSLFLRASVQKQLTERLGALANKHTRGLYFAWDQGQLTVDTLLYSTNRQWAKLTKNGKRVLAKDREATFIQLMRPQVRKLLDSLTNLNPLWWHFIKFTACIYYESNELDIQVTIKDQDALDQALYRSDFSWNNKPRPKKLQADVIDLT